LPQFAPPVTLSITSEQLLWLDRRRRQGSLSRSAALRLLLDQLMAHEAAQRRGDESRADG
jgi:hypothetical protein